MIKPEGRLREMVQSGKVPHALLFCGPKGSGKKEAAYQFAAQLLETEKKIENHPDIHLFFPEGKLCLHAIESMRKLSGNTALAPFSGKWKIFIVHSAEQMLPTSSNALLKTVEEPSAQTVIMLLSDHPERLLPTLVSRCSVLHFCASKIADPKAELRELLIGKINKKSFIYFDQENADLIFETILCWFRDRFLLEIGQKEYLHFPQYLEQLKMTPYLSLDAVEKRLKQIRLAHDRSTKLSLCLEMFFLPLFD